MDAAAACEKNIAAVVGNVDVQVHEEIFSTWTRAAALLECIGRGQCRLGPAAAGKKGYAAVVSNVEITMYDIGHDEILLCRCIELGWGPLRRLGHEHRDSPVCADESWMLLAARGTHLSKNKKSIDFF